MTPDRGDQTSEEQRSAESLQSLGVLDGPRFPGESDWALAEWPYRVMDSLGTDNTPQPHSFRAVLAQFLLFSHLLGPLSPAIADLQSPELHNEDLGGTGPLLLTHLYPGLSLRFTH